MAFITFSVLTVSRVLVDVASLCLPTNNPMPHDMGLSLSRSGYRLFALREWLGLPMEVTLDQETERTSNVFELIQ